MMRAGIPTSDAGVMRRQGPGANGAAVLVSEKTKV
jgi:hypothetical protein